MQLLPSSQIRDSLYAFIPESLLMNMNEQRRANAAWTEYPMAGQT